MNIGIVTTWFERGASQVSRQYRDILKSEHNVFIYARGGENYAKNDSNWNTSDVTWGKKTIFQTNGTPIHKSDFKRWITKNNIEIILFNEQQWWLPIIWAKDWGVTVGSYIDYYTKDTVPFFEVFDFLICNTKRHFSAFNWHKNSHFVMWGTDTSLYKPIKNSNQKLVFFNSAGHNPDRKGVGDLIDAFHSLNPEGAKLLIHSQVDLFKYYASKKNKIQKLIQDKKLDIITKTVGAPGLYHLGDVYCYISKLDGIGLTVPEAISCGLPVIAPNHPPMNEFVKDGINGKLVDVDGTYFREDGYYWPQIKVNNNSLKKALQFYIDNIEKIDDYKKNSREYASKELEWSDRKNKINKIFNRAKSTKSQNIEKKIMSYEFKKYIKNLYRFPIVIIKTLMR
jgi:glycosyltransferase involved in cell wall biosynthesis